MSSVCFTGAGRRHGKEYVRTFWEADAVASGWQVHDKVFPHTEYLVASRLDTSKAEAARLQGTTVISYAEFVKLLDGGGASSDPVADRERERQEAADRVAAKRAARASNQQALAEAEDSIEGWGSF